MLLLRNLFLESLCTERAFCKSYPILILNLDVEMLNFFFILFLFVLLCQEVELMHVSTFYLPMLKKSFLFLAVQRNQFCLRSFVKPRKARNL